MRLAALLLSVALGLTLTACGDDSSGDPSARQTASNGDVFNDADVTFATQMIPHHAEAVQMVVMAQDRPLDPEVRELADAIRDAQVLEVETMVTWLTSWGEEIPETSLDHANAGHGDDMDHGDLQALADASDEEFQDLWLEMMVEHHEGAIAMAQDEQAGGLFKQAVRLARDIVKTQGSEIEHMQGLLGQ